MYTKDSQDLEVLPFRSFLLDRRASENLSNITLKHPDSWTSGTGAAHCRQSGLKWSAWPQDHTGLEILSAGMVWRRYQQGLPGNTAQNGPCFPAPASMYPGPTAQPFDLNSVGPWNRKSPEEKNSPFEIPPPPRFINFITFYNKH